MNDTRQVSGAPPEIKIDAVIARTPLSRQYKVGLLVVAVVIVLLPVLYLLLAAGIAYGVYLHATLNSGLMDHHPYFHQVLLYLVPLISGVLLVGFMLKPLAVNFWSREELFELKPDDAPEFHRFVAEIARSLRVPPPKKILINLEVNAGAQNRRRMLWLRREPVLIIGLPLLLCLSAQQLGGVIAHEICHLSQRTAMWLSTLIRTVNYWLAFAVYGPNTIHEILSAEIGPMSIITGPARLLVWVTRGILWSLMHAGYTISHYLLHQMELDADRYAARVAGRDSYAETQRRLAVMGPAVTFAFDDLFVAHHKGNLPDNIVPILFSNHAAATAIGARIGTTEFLYNANKYLQSHPPHRERIANVSHEPEEAAIGVTDPVLTLFRNFDAVAKAFTRDWYGRWREKPRGTSGNAAELLRGVGKDAAALGGFERYFGLPFSADCPLAIAEDASGPGGPLDAEAAREGLRQAREQARLSLATWSQAARRFSAAQERWIECRASQMMDPDGQQAKSLAAAQSEVDVALAELRPFHEQARQRLLLTLGAVQRSAIALNVDIESDLKRLLPALYALGKLALELARFRAGHLAFAEAVCRLSMQVRVKKIEKLMRLHTEEAARRLAWFQTELGGTAYPFEHATENMTIRKYAIPVLPEAGSLFDTLGKAEDMALRLQLLHFCALSRCAFHAAAIEDELLLPRR